MAALSDRPAARVPAGDRPAGWRGGARARSAACGSSGPPRGPGRGLAGCAPLLERLLGGLGDRL